jgi:hypothetical protein
MRAASAPHRVAKAEEDSTDEHQPEEDAQQGTRSQGNLRVRADRVSERPGPPASSGFLFLFCVE